MGQKAEGYSNWQLTAFNLYLKESVFYEISKIVSVVWYMV